MTSKEHKKHTSLEKPISGFFHRREISLIGAPCSVIDGLATMIQKHLIEINIATTYINASHNHMSPPDPCKVITFEQGFELHSKETPFSMSALLQDKDIVLLNGNHHMASVQVVILNSSKKESLSKKIEKLTNVVCFIADDIHQPYEFLDFIDPKVPIYSKTQMTDIVTTIFNHFADSKPPLHALVLAGGQSSRMGFDKAKIVYHKLPQYKYLVQLCNQLGLPSFLSLAIDDIHYQNEYKIFDSFIGLGPFGALLSAMKQFPNAAILSMPCDTPNIDESILNHLIQHRNPFKHATCYLNPETNFPEPLITIWEPTIYPIMLQFLALGYTCPRKVLINTKINTITYPKDRPYFFNINSPSDLESYHS